MYGLSQATCMGLDPESVFATGTPSVGFENASPPTSRIFYVNLSLGF